MKIFQILGRGESLDCHQHSNKEENLRGGGEVGPFTIFFSILSNFQLTFRQ